MVAVGPAYLLQQGCLSVEPGYVPADRVGLEIDRLESAFSAARQSLQNLRQQIPDSTPQDVAEFLQAHLLMLEDRGLIDPTRELIRTEHFSAEWALQQHRDALVQAFESMEDPYLRSRREDVDHVVGQVMSFLRQEENAREKALEGDISGCVIVAHDIPPAEAILLHHRGAAAFVTELGGPLSHTAILARSLNIPMVMGVHNATHYLHPGEILVVDGGTGTVLADADASILHHYRKQRAFLRERRIQLQGLLKKPAESRDGIPIRLLANLELPEDVQSARANGAVGIGLYRTEFLYMNRSQPPDEEEHFQIYREILQGLGGIPLTIRTLDLGADKLIREAEPCGSACNPALGLRAIRLCLREPELFRPQLRAILRLSALGPVRLLLPMLTSVQEIEAVFALLTQIRRELAQEGIPFDPTLPVGGMIEVPAAAICATAFAARLDFLSIGTNDLIQYSLAIDRVDDAVSYLYDPLHPAVLRLIRRVIEAGRQLGKPVAMCGEMAGDPRYTRLLLGLGLREFSMQPGSLLEVKEVVRAVRIEPLSREIDRLYPHLDRISAETLMDHLNRLH